jgi:hypothetical protein
MSTGNLWKGFWASLSNGADDALRAPECFGSILFGDMDTTAVIARHSEPEEKGVVFPKIDLPLTRLDEVAMDCGLDSAMTGETRTFQSKQG